MEKTLVNNGGAKVTLEHKFYRDGFGTTCEPSENTGTDQYSKLYKTLIGCFEQASKGKGEERHADNQAFEDQPIMWIEKNFKSFQLGQAVKKIHESQRLPRDMAIEELKGAIVFLSARIMFLENTDKEEI